MKFLVLLTVTGCVVGHAAAAAEEKVAGAEWISRFSFVPLAASEQSVCRGTIGDLPRIVVEQARPGDRLVRVSVPFAPGALPAGMGLQAVSESGEAVPCDIRPLTYHPGAPKSVRRGLVSFAFEFGTASEYVLELVLTQTRQHGESKTSRVPEGWRVTWNDVTVTMGGDRVSVHQGSHEPWQARLIAPARSGAWFTELEVVEDSPCFLWIRLLAPDPTWPRIVELRMDRIGNVLVQGHLQRLLQGDGFAPDMGWCIEALGAGNELEHSFRDGRTISLEGREGLSLSFPDAAMGRRGRVFVSADEVSYLRCTEAEKVPYQEAAWRRASFFAGVDSETQCRPSLEWSVRAKMLQEGSRDGTVKSAPASYATWPQLQRYEQYAIQAIEGSMLTGDDFGNITTFQHGDEPPVYGMNRLNHCPPIFRSAERLGNYRLRDAAVLWCFNMYDLSLWWGDDAGFGGTRYNNAAAIGQRKERDPSFMWRTNSASNFCTKGFDSFFRAYEVTGDPRMAVALRHQVAYSKSHVHADQGECRNIGDAADFLHLHEATGDTAYLDEALRLFRELRTRLSPGDLFSQGGAPIAPDPPFIDDDQHGYGHPFAKPYIIGYALAGLPGLLEHAPDEPKLRDVVRAVADFLAESVDPIGGWRYPHPNSSRTLIGHSLENAAQLCRAAEALERRGEPIGNLLDAIEPVLQFRLGVFARTGQIPYELVGWERSTGVVNENQSIYEMYQKAGDRDPSRDYTEGTLSVGTAPPEGLVYLWEVLDYYLSHRPAERLFNTSPEMEQVLQRLPQSEPLAETPSPRHDQYGMKARLPKAHEAMKARLNFPLAWREGNEDLASWRANARDVLLDALLPPPPRVPFASVVLAVEDRGAYEARKLVFNVSADSRVLAYLLVPHGDGPFPALLALHDHGAHFSIGKEKVIRPFGVSPERLADARHWVDQHYGGRWFGDALAEQGYVVFSTDALFWGDRGRAEGVEYAAQQVLAANMLQLGRSWAGTIVWDDMRSAAFVRSLPEVDPERVGCIGLSMGANRAWHLAAATDSVKLGAAICWMGDTAALMAEGNNQTTGQSAFSMLHPGLRNQLDFPDVASIACPKPMLFYNGAKDGLFPVPGVEACYQRMRTVWRDQNADGNLVTRIWPVAHEFSLDMQAEAFAWLDQHLARR